MIIQCTAIPMTSLLPWDGKGQMRAIHWLIQNPRFKAASDKLKEKYKYDFYTSMLGEYNTAGRIRELAESFIDDLEKIVNHFELSESEYASAIDSWYNSITDNWDSSNDEITHLCGLIKLESKFRSLRQKLETRYGVDKACLQHFDSMVE